MRLTFMNRLSVEEQGKDGAHRPLGVSPGGLGLTCMAVQQPFTSGSHWRGRAPASRATPLLRAPGQSDARDMAPAPAQRAQRLGGTLAASALAVVTLGGVFA